MKRIMKRNMKHKRLLFDTPDKPDQRQSANLYLSILIDVGVTYKRALGDAAARAFFAEQAIPNPIALRVMADNPARRLTDWERHARQASLSRADQARAAAEEAPPSVAE